MLQHSALIVMGAEAQHPMEGLHKIAREGSCMVLRHAGEVNVVILQMVGQ
jgi:hypothetical protein